MIIKLLDVCRVMGLKQNPVRYPPFRPQKQTQNLKTASKANETKPRDTCPPGGIIPLGEAEKGMV